MIESTSEPKTVIIDLPFFDEDRIDENWVKSRAFKKKFIVCQKTRGSLSEDLMVLYEIEKRGIVEFDWKEKNNWENSQFVISAKEIKRPNVSTKLADNEILLTPEILEKINNIINLTKQTK